MIYLQNHLVGILIILFLLITFLISTFEKISDWSGNVIFIKVHFKFSPLKNMVPFLLAIILLLDIVGCSFLLVGLYDYIFYDKIFFAFYGIAICSIILIFLLIGQRLAKDYEGAMNITIYFILTILGLFLLNR